MVLVSSLLKTAIDDAYIFTAYSYWVVLSISSLFVVINIVKLYHTKTDTLDEYHQPLSASTMHEYHQYLVIFHNTKK